MASFDHFFNIAHLNIRGLASKLDEVKGVISNHKFQIFCLTETFIHKDEIIFMKFLDMILLGGIELKSLVVASYATYKIVLIMSS